MVVCFSRAERMIIYDTLDLLSAHHISIIAIF